MNFDTTEEQRALEDTVRRFIAKDYNFDHRRNILATPAGWSREVWKGLADLGVLALTIDEQYGGMGYGPLESALVMNAFGAGLLVEPYLAAAVVAPTLIRGLADSALQDSAAQEFQAEWLPKIAGGEAIVILADDEARGDTMQENKGLLRGKKSVVTHGGSADLLLVTAATEEGGGVFAVVPGTQGVAIRDYPMLDGQRAAEITLDGVLAQKVGAGDTAPAVTAAQDVGLAALCAEAVGIIDATIAATSEYLKTRQQFGQPIGRFQVLQHRMADMLLHAEQARSMSLLAALRCRDENVAERQRVLSAAKVVVGNACRFVAQNSVQLHGGMGMTDELIVSHWFKRLTAIEMSFGDTDMHLQRFSVLSLQALRAA